MTTGLDDIARETKMLIFFTAYRRLASRTRIGSQHVTDEDLKAIEVDAIDDVCRTLAHQFRDVAGVDARLRLVAAEAKTHFAEMRKAWAERH